MVAQDFAAEGIDSDVLRCREQREERRQPQDGPDVLLWTEAAEEADGEQREDADVFAVDPAELSSLAIEMHGPVPGLTTEESEAL